MLKSLNRTQTTEVMRLQTLGDDVEMGARIAGGASTRSVRCQCRRIEKFSSRDATEGYSQIESSIMNIASECPLTGTRL